MPRTRTHTKLGVLLILLGLCTTRTVHADTKVCVSEGHASFANCQGSIFNIHVEFRDAAESSLFIATLNATANTDEELKKRIQALDVKYVSLGQRIARETDSANELKRSLAELKQQHQSDALFSSEMKQRYERLEATVKESELGLRQLQQTYYRRADFVSRSIEELYESSECDKQRMDQLERQLAQTQKQLAMIYARGGLSYNATRARLSAILTFGLEGPFRQQRRESVETQALGIRLGYLPPGHWFISPAVGFVALKGAGTAVVTDPRGIDLGKTSSWRSRAYLVTLDISFGHDFGPLSLYVRAGVRTPVVASTYSTTEFGEASDFTASYSYPCGFGITLRPIVGAVLQFGVGMVYWSGAQPARYVYQGPTGAATLASPETRLDFDLATGFGYVVTL